MVPIIVCGIVLCVIDAGTHRDSLIYHNIINDIVMGSFVITMMIIIIITIIMGRGKKIEINFLS